jgi:hypothetical protein
MAESHVVVALRKKYARTIGMLLVHEGDPIRLTADATHLAAALLIFKPDENVLAIKPIRPWTNHRGENTGTWARMALDILRQAKRPMTTREIANKIAAAKGVKGYLGTNSIECALHLTLERRIGMGIVRLEGSPKRWAVEP